MRALRLPRGWDQVMSTKLVDVLDGVAQGVVCVVRGVWTDQHIRQALEPHHGLVVDELTSAVGVEDSFLSFDYIECRAAQLAALQCAEEGLCIEQ